MGGMRVGSLAGLVGLAVLICSMVTITAYPRAVTAAPLVASCAPDSGSATLSGTVTGAGSAPLNGVLVTAYTLYGQRGGAAYTNASGVYTITGLIGGSYLLKFEPGSGEYAAEYYSNQATPEAATPVSVPEGGSTSGVNAQIEPGARFSGTVTGEGGAPLQSVSVNVYNAAGQSVARAFTDASGNYTTGPGLPSGSYRIGVSGSVDYQDGFYSGKASLEEADPLTVTAPAVRSGVDITMARGGRISGTVTNADTGLPVSGVQVAASGQGGFDSDSTDASGAYELTGLGSGSYQLSASASGSVNLVGVRQTVTVTAPATLSGVDLTMAPGGTLTGQVTDTGGAPLGSITIYVSNSEGSYQRYVTTNASGVYTATAMPSGTYTVFFRPTSYIPELYNDQPDFEQAERIEVLAPGTVTGIDAALARGSGISGTVTAAGTGAPIQYVFVEVLDEAGSRVESAFTRADGTYEIKTTLASGSYRLRFGADERFASCAYVTEYYNDQPGEASADLLTVTAPASLTNVNAELTRGSIMFGKLTDATTGAPITRGGVSIYDAAGEVVMFGRLTFLGGWYSATALPSGSYRVKFRDFDTGYIDEFYDDKLSLAAADPITLTAPDDVAGIDAALAKGAGISGRVTAADSGEPFSEGYVVVYDASGEEVGSSSIQSDGSYRVLDGLPDGSYLVAAVPYGAAAALNAPAQSSGASPGYSVTFYGAALARSGATPVVLTAPLTREGIDIAMLRGAWLPLIKR